MRSTSTGLERLFTPVQYVPGVGPRRARALEKCDPPVRVVEDLFLLPPKAYIPLTPRTAVEVLREVRGGSGAPLVFEGRIETRGEIVLRNRPALSLILVDPQETGAVEVVVPLPRDPAQQHAIRNQYPRGLQLRILARFTLPPRSRFPRAVGFRKLNEDALPPARFAGLYRQCGRLSTADFLRMIAAALERYGDALEEFLPPDVLRRRHFPERKVAVERLHFPPGRTRDPRAWRRLAYEELFLYFLELFRENRPLQTARAPVIQPRGTLLNPFFQRLPFALTGAQERVWAEIQQDLASGRPMHRLLQGDVGSGKTLVSLLAALAVVENGYQVAVMAPTEILAEQLFMVYTSFLEDLSVRVELLEGSLAPGRKARIKEAVQTGEVQILVGTHALIQEDVTFARLGLAVVDEQHRFGVLQRAALLRKGMGEEVPHFLVMTATPIPRTLALTLYGDLDVSVIGERPHRGTVTTTWVRSPGRREELYRRLFSRVLEEGLQAYVVAPLVEASEKLQVQAAEALFEELQGKAPEGLRLGLVHGRMSARDRREIMEAFRRGDIHILVATTVIEVGVDVPGATVMVIEDAHRFGLSQLHQLRGRILRSDRDAHCVVITPPRVSGDARKRLKVFVEESDGFRIAEADLVLRGPGELHGTRQHGLPRFVFADLSGDPVTLQVIQEARQDARAVVEEDPDLVRPEHVRLRRYLELRRSHRKLVTVA